MLSALTWFSESRLSSGSRVSNRDKTRLEKLCFMVMCTAEYEISWPFLKSIHSSSIKNLSATLGSCWVVLLERNLLHHTGMLQSL